MGKISLLNAFKTLSSFNLRKLLHTLIANSGKPLFGHPIFFRYCRFFSLFCEFNSSKVKVIQIMTGVFRYFTVRCAMLWGSIVPYNFEIDADLEFETRTFHYFLLWIGFVVTLSDKRWFLRSLVRQLPKKGCKAYRADSVVCMVRFGKIGTVHYFYQALNCYFCTVIGTNCNMIFWLF